MIREDIPEDVIALNNNYDFVNYYEKLISYMRNIFKTALIMLQTRYSISQESINILIDVEVKSRLNNILYFCVRINKITDGMQKIGCSIVDGVC